MHPTHKPAQPVGVGIDPVELTPAEVLHGAALYIQRHGLHRGEMFANLRAATPAACAQGGLKMAVCGGPDVTWTPATSSVFDHALGVLADYLRTQYAVWTPEEFIDDPAILVAEWNDRIATDLQEVTNALNAAADQWDR